MLLSETETEGDLIAPFSYFAGADQDDIFEQNIDAFDEEMDNAFDDGIEQSDVDHLEDDSDEEDHGHHEDNISPFDYNDEFADYDELEE